MGRADKIFKLEQRMIFCCRLHRKDIGRRTGDSPFLFNEIVLFKVLRKKQISLLFQNGFPFLAHVLVKQYFKLFRPDLSSLFLKALGGFKKSQVSSYGVISPLAIMTSEESL